MYHSIISNRSVLRFCFLLGVLGFSTFNSTAQTSRLDTLLSTVTIGGGVAFSGGHLGPAFRIQTSWGPGWMVSLQTIAIQRIAKNIPGDYLAHQYMPFQIFGNNKTLPRDLSYISSLTFGKKWFFDQSKTQIDFSTGPAWAKKDELVDFYLVSASSLGAENYKWKHHISRSFGWGIYTGLDLPAARWLGLHLGFFAVAAKPQSLVGLQVNLLIGKLYS